MSGETQLIPAKNMKTFITLCSLIAAIALGYQYNAAGTRAKDAETRVKDAENHANDATAKLAGATQQLAETSTQLNAANAKLIALSAKPVPVPKTNWIEERNKNWRSSLGEPATGNRRAITSPTTYYNTPSRYWTDSAGGR